MKKKVIKPFDMEAAKAGAEVETRAGRKVRIICFDKKGDYPIIALLDGDTKELVFPYRVNGTLNRNPSSEHKNDLVIVEEVEEDTEFVPFQRVLVRDSNTQIWKPSVFSYYDPDSEYRFCVVGGNSYKYCIPYNDNEHLSCTKDNPK